MLVGAATVLLGLGPSGPKAGQLEKRVVQLESLLQQETGRTLAMQRELEELRSDRRAIAADRDSLIEKLRAETRAHPRIFSPSVR
eukprot:m51a1_g13025 hypothetical protein (85) ;mRNA; r:131-1580